MPDRKRVEDFIAEVVGGDHVKAIADYYHEDASMQENAKSPRKGRGTLMDHEAKVPKRLQKMHTHPDVTFLVDGDLVVIHWTFDATDMSGVRRRLEELSLQRWRGDRIIEERFFYDTATAWQALKTPKEPA